MKRFKRRVVSKNKTLDTVHKRRTIGGTKPRAFERKESTQKEPMLLSKCMKKVHEQEIEKDQKRDTFACITVPG